MNYVDSCQVERPTASCGLPVATRGVARELYISGVARLEQQMREKSSSAEGQQGYARRNHLVEPVFGNIKFNLGFDRFHLRTLAKVAGEFQLICLAHNIRKLAARFPGWGPIVRRARRRLLQAYLGLTRLIQTFLETIWRDPGCFGVRTTHS
ncbi:MAG: transposase [Candidatus Zixiibacteriota bacterium]